MTGWGNTHTTNYPGFNNTISVSEPFNKKNTAHPPIDCCKELELQIQDIYRRICNITNPTETPITVINTLSVNLTATGTANHTLTANVNIDPTIGNKLILKSGGLFSNPATFSASYNNGNGNLTIIVDGQQVILNIPSSSPKEDVVYYGTSFTGDTLIDSTLNNLSYKVFFRAMSSFLIRTVEWDYISGGGFQLLNGVIPDSSDIFFVQFY